MYSRLHCSKLISSFLKINNVNVQKCNVENLTVTLSSKVVCQSSKSCSPYSTSSSSASGSSKSEHSEPLTLVTEENGIRTICLNNPKKRNALSLAMLEQLWKDLGNERNVRVVILKAKGPVFSAGHYLKELTAADGRQHHEKVFSRCTHLMTLLQEMSVPVIAQVNGLATAAGCQLVASCDIAVVSDKSRFATPGVNIGLFCSTPAVALGRAVPRKVAMEMLFTGKPISAEDALLHGLVNKVVPEEQLKEETMKIANAICEKSKSVIALGKVAFNEQMKLDQKSAYKLTEVIMANNLQLEDGQEGIQSFIEKRQPIWKHTMANIPKSHKDLENDFDEEDFNRRDDTDFDRYK